MSPTVYTIEQKMKKDSTMESNHYECLTAEEREIYADHLAERKHYRSAILFTLDESKRERFRNEMRWKNV